MLTKAKLAAEKRLELVHVSLMRNPNFAQFSGLFMVGKKLSEGRAETLAMTGTKLLLHPALTALLLIFVFPTDPTWMKVAILMAALPTGTGSFVLAQAYGVYVLRTSSATLATTVLSVVTIAIFFIVFPPGR